MKVIKNGNTLINLDFNNISSITTKFVPKYALNHNIYPVELTVQLSITFTSGHTESMTLYSIDINFLNDFNKVIEDKNKISEISTYYSNLETRVKILADKIDQYMFYKITGNFTGIIYWNNTLSEFDEYINDIESLRHLGI